MASDNRLRIVFFTDEYPPDHGGVGRSVARIARGVHGEQYQASVVVLEDRMSEPVVQLQRDGEILVWRFGQLETGDERRQEREAQRLMRILDHFRQRQVELFHAFFPTTTGMYTGIVARAMGKPFLASFRGNDIYQGIFGRHLQSIRWVLEVADKVTFVNEEMATIARAIEPRCAPWEVVPNAVIPFDAPTTTKRSFDSPVVLGSTGVFRSKKGMRTLFQAHRQLQEVREAHLLLVGDFARSEREYWWGLLGEGGLKEKVTVTGLLPPREALSYLAEMDVFVYPSLHDGCPNSLLEAAYAGVPLVCSRIAATRELLEEGKECLMHDSEDASELVHAIVDVLEQPGPAQLRAEAARDKVLRLFSPEQERETWQRIYNQLLSSAGEPSNGP